MAQFGQNQQLNQLLNAGGMQGFQPQTPSFNMGTIPSGKGGFWEGLKNLFAGSPNQFAYSSPYGQNQQQAFQNILGMGLQNQQNPYEGFDLLKDQVMRHYQEEILPQLAEQFASTGGAPSSPSFLGQLQRGAQGLSERLLAHKIGYGQQNRSFGLQQAQLGLTPQFENAYVPGQPGLLQGLLGSVPQLASSGLKYALLGRQ